MDIIIVMILYLLVTGVQLWPVVLTNLTSCHHDSGNDFVGVVIAMLVYQVRRL